MPRRLLVHAVELLRRPGTRRDIDLEVDPEELGLDDARLLPDSPIGVIVHLESLADGIVVVGILTAAWSGTCRRCLRPVAGATRADVHELYQQTVTDPDAFPIAGDMLDLEPMVRETILLDLPADPLCTPDCAGLCPVCGADRNQEPCACEAPVGDDRWAVLDALRDRLTDGEG